MNRFLVENYISRSEYDLVKTELSNTKIKLEKANALLHNFETADISSLVMKNHELEEIHKLHVIEINDLRAALKIAAPTPYGKIKPSNYSQLEEAVFNLRVAFEYDVKSIEVSKHQYNRLKWYLDEKRHRSGVWSFSLSPFERMEFFGIHIKEEK